jgi:hypothetical protein
MRAGIVIATRRLRSPKMGSKSKVESAFKTKANLKKKLIHVLTNNFVSFVSVLKINKK